MVDHGCGYSLLLVVYAFLGLHRQGVLLTWHRMMMLGGAKPWRSRIHFTGAKDRSTGSETGKQVACSSIFSIQLMQARVRITVIMN